MEKKTAIIVGMGEIGNAVLKVLEPEHTDGQVFCTDISQPIGDSVLHKFKFMHICFPFKDGFLLEVQNYIEQYDPDIVCIHSTVAVGTTERLMCMNPNIIYAHCPVMGRHDKIADAMTTFRRFVGCHNGSVVSQIAHHLKCQAVWMRQPRDTELGKLLDTAYLGWCVAFEKQAKAMAEKHGCNHTNTYRRFNNVYNEGYSAMEEEQFIRPVLDHVPGPIGGHCVIPNAKLLGGMIGEFLLQYNDKLKGSGQ